MTEDTNEWRAVGLTDVGLRRTSNQDHIVVDERDGLFILADGMGGHSAGERASRMASWHIYRYLRDEIHKERTLTQNPLPPQQRWERALGIAVQSANRHVFDYAQSYPQYEGMGTTIVAVVLADGHAFVAHAGDSRLYRISDDEIVRATKDHSRLQDLIDACELSEEDAKNHPFRNVITRSLGNHPEVEVDIGHFQPDAGEILLLCTDGLTGVMTDKEILKVIDAAGRDLEKSSRWLLQAVTKAGAPDNVSVIMVAPAQTKAPSGT